MARSDPTLEALGQDPKAAELLKNKDALRSLLGSPETRRLMDLLNQNAGGGLQNAAQAAAKGKPQELMDLLGRVMKSKEGAQAVEGLQKKAEKK